MMRTRMMMTPKLLATTARFLSSNVKGTRIADAEGLAIWRHTDSLGKKLQTMTTYHKCDTLGQLWDRAVKSHSKLPCMGTREVLQSHVEKAVGEGRDQRKLVLGAYKWMDYRDVDAKISALCDSLNKLGLRKGQHVTIYAETRAEWMITANACFKKGLPVVTIYPTLTEEGIKQALEESDAVAIFTTHPLMSTLLNAVGGAPRLKHVVYYSELHRDPRDVKAGTQSTIDESTKRRLTAYHRRSPPPLDSDVLKHYEIPWRVLICSEVWDSDTETRTGLLTETKKLKRRRIELEYRDEIREMFASKKP